MQRKVHVVAFALLSSLAPATPAAAQQTAPQSDIKIVYETPTNPKLTSIYTRLKQRKVLEELQAFMVPLRLPRDLTVRLAQCGSENIPYRAQVPATVCYELIDKIEQVAVSHTNDPDLQQTVIIGGFVPRYCQSTHVQHALYRLWRPARLVQGLRRIPLASARAAEKLPSRISKGQNGFPEYDHALY
jgi:hypothetical protein